MENFIFLCCKCLRQDPKRFLTSVFPRNLQKWLIFRKPLGDCLNRRLYWKSNSLDTRPKLNINKTFRRLHVQFISGVQGGLRYSPNHLRSKRLRSPLIAYLCFIWDFIHYQCHTVVYWVNPSYRPTFTSCFFYFRSPHLSTLISNLFFFLTFL